jgi:hypothetical protein
VTGVWDDRLAEVWAAPGKAGAGVVVGADTVLTARHVLAGALADSPVLARVVRPGTVAAEWVPMQILGEDDAWDVAVLVADPESERGAPGWLQPASASPKVVRLGTAAELGCEAVGFPQSEVRRLPGGSAGIRQSEQVWGTLTPAGQAKAPVDVGRPLPRRWVPLAVDGPTPGAHADWAGMSGAGVVLSDGRLAGIVVGAEAGHQLRRFYVVLIADVLDHSAAVAGALSAALGFQVVPEARTAPLFRNVLREPSMGEDGLPVSVREASLRAFGVRAAGLPGEPEFLDYVPRSRDQRLRDKMLAAQADRRMLLVVGGSAAGKSRSSAEAARDLFGDYRLLCPRHTALTRLPDLPITEVSPALVWLDDVERYDERALRDTVETLRRSGVTMIATIRRGELEARMPRADRRSALEEALHDEELVTQMPWPAEWSPAELASVTRHVSDPSLLKAVSDGTPPSEWVVAGPDLQKRLDDARADDERPARYALVRAVLDWYRTGTAQTISMATATRLLQESLPKTAEQPEAISDAFSWAFESVLGRARTTRQSLLTTTPDGDGLVPHDYIQDRDAASDRTAIPDSVLAEALRQAPAGDARLAIGEAAHSQGSDGIASDAFLPGPAMLETIHLETIHNALEADERALLLGAGPSSADQSSAGQNPYRGLMPFSEADAGAFYGRERLTAELVVKLAARLEQGGPVVVTGASGAGKSSLLRAGLLPALARGAQILGSDGWPRMVIQPGRRPLAELAAQVAVLAGEDAAVILAELTDDPGQAQMVIRRAVAADSARRTGGNTRLVLIVDQFEQIFTLSTEPGGEAERRAFITAICAAAAKPAGPLHQPPAAVILSVRGDFWDRMAAYPELARALQDGAFVVGPMTGADLYEAATGPAAAAGLEIEPALADTIRADLETATDSGDTIGLLPLLSQAMLLTWENREGNRLTSRGYELAGGVSLAVQVSADNAYNALTVRQRDLVPGLMRAMTVVSSDRRFTRRPVTREELYSGHPISDRAEIDAILDELAARRLVVLNGNTAELGHEALIQAWPRLRAWLADDQASLHIYSELAEDAYRWQANSGDSSFLYSRTRLATLQSVIDRWAADPGRLPELSGIQREYLRASSRLAARATRQRRAVIAALVALLLVAATGSVTAVISRRNAVLLTAAAASGQLADKSESLGTADAATAAQLAAAAWRISPTAEAYQAMQDVVTKADLAVLKSGQVTIPANGGAATAVAFSPDGRTLAIASSDRTELWDVAADSLTLTEITGPPGVAAVAFSPNGTILATASGRAFQLWDFTDPAFLRLIGVFAAGEAKGVTAVAFNPDGTILATASAAGTVRLWNVAAVQPIGPTLTVGSLPVTAVAFSPDGTILATASDDGTTRLWNLKHPEAPTLMAALTANARAVTAVAFSPDNTTLATASDDGTARLWDVATGRQTGLPLAVSSLPVTAVEFSPDGKILATGSDDHTARLWNVATGNQIGGALPAGSLPVTAVAFSPDGTTLATASADGTAQLWQLKYRGSLGSLFSRVCDIAGGSLTRQEWSHNVPGEPFQQVCP